MNRPSKKEIKAVVDSLKVKPNEHNVAGEPNMGKPSAKKTSRRIRKQGV